MAKNSKTSNLLEYRPYSLSRQSNDIYVDILFQDEGIMTVPKTSGNAIVELLNDAFRNGVKMTLKTNSMQSQSQSVDLEPEFKPSPMPQEEEHPINRQVKRL
jgi:hypothetical protein